MAISLHRALHSLKLEYVDILLLGMHNQPPSQRLKEAAWKLRDSGQVRFIAVSCHRRSTFHTYVEEGFFDVLMFRYNAAHRGAETEVLPLLNIPNRPGTVAYTATRWGQFLDSSKLPREEKTPTASDCYRFVLTQPNVDICLTRPNNMEQLRESLTSLDRGPMNTEELAWMCRVGDYLHGNSAAQTLRIRLLQGRE
jgi:aryl-alcohol dehydrogenase-like predicted oxidoreductase